MEDSSDQSLYEYVKYKMAHSDFVHGFIASLSMIIVSELGDKTFFIAAIMSMRHSRVVVLAGALGALVAMTILSGKLFTHSHHFTHEIVFPLASFSMAPRHAPFL